jgi:hypothetical protein
MHDVGDVVVDQRVRHLPAAALGADQVARPQHPRSRLLRSTQTSEHTNVCMSTAQASPLTVPPPV